MKIPILLLILITINLLGLISPGIVQGATIPFYINPGATNSESQNPISPLANFTIIGGNNVTWINKDSSPHMLVSGTPGKGPNNIFYGDFFGTNENYTVLFEKPGVYPYYDPAWSHIRGVITVENPQISLDFETNTNQGGINGIDGSIGIPSNTSDNSNFNTSNFNPSDDSFTSFPSSSTSSSSAVSPSATFPTFTTDNTSDKSFAPSLLTSGHTLANIINKIGPLLGNLMKENSSVPSSSSLPPSSKIFDSNDSLNKSSTLSSANTQSSNSGLTLANIINKIGPLLGNLMKENSRSSYPSSPLLSSSQSNGTFGNGDTGIINSSNPDTNDNVVSDNISVSPINNISTTQNGSISSLDEKRREVQHTLIKDLKIAYSIEAEIPVLSDFQPKGQNATIFVKVSVINPPDRVANASDFKFRLDYERTDGSSSGWYFINANDAGRFIVLPASNYNITTAQLQSEDQTKDAFLKSYSTFYSKGCSGSIDDIEIKDCIIIKKYSNATNNPSATPGLQSGANGDSNKSGHLSINGGINGSENGQFVSPMSNEQSTSELSFDIPTTSTLPVPIKGIYTDNTSGIRITFPQNWNGSENIDTDNVKLAVVTLKPSQSLSKNFSDNIPPYIFVEISPKAMFVSDKPLQYKDIINYGKTEYTKSCDLLTSHNVTISSTPAKEIAYSCPFPFNPSVKQLVNAIAIEKSQNNIAIEFTAVSESNYAKYLPDFEGAVKSIQFTQ